MKIRLPWILSRKRLITAVLIDGFLFSFIYNFLFLLRFDKFPGPSPWLAILLSIWLLGSYIVGRYASGDARRHFDITLSLIKQCTCTAFMLAITLALV